MGARLFCNQTSRNDSVRIQAGGENMYGALRGRLPARLIALFTIRSAYMQQDTVYRLAGVQFMSLVDSGRPSDVHGLVTVQLREVTRELHNCGYRDDHRPGASATGDRAALACQQSDRFTHV